MKVMILANNDAGLYKFRRELLEELLKKHQVMICLPEGEYIKDLTEMGCKFIPCNLLERRGMNPAKELKLIRFYREVLKEQKPDIVFTYTIKPNVYGGMVCGSLGIPYAANITGLGTAVENAGLMQKVTLTLYKLGLKKAQMVFFQNAENKTFMLEKGVVKGRYFQLPGSGVNLEHYQPMEYPKGDTIDFVFIARLMKEKGIDNYLDTAEVIRREYPQTRFHICGFCEDDYTARLNDLQEKGVIIYHGMVKDMTAIYRQISCTIHPTYYPEGLSNVLLESSASARPIITTNRAGCREVIDDGVNGYICKQNDSEDLIKQVEKFLSLSWEERKNMGLAGRVKVEKEFDRKIVINKYLQEVQRVQR